MLRVREPSWLSIPSFTWNIERSGFNSRAHVFWESRGYHWVYSFWILSLNGQILILLMIEENLSNGNKLMFTVEVSVLDLHVFIEDDQVIWKNVGVDKELYWSLCFKLENFHCQRIIVELKIAETFKDLAYVVEGITKFEVHSVNLGKPQTCSIVGHFFRDFLLTFQMTKTGYWLSIAQMGLRHLFKYCNYWPMTISGPLKIWTISDFVFFGAAKKTRSHIDICCEAGIVSILSFMSSWKKRICFAWRYIERLIIFCEFCLPNAHYYCSGSLSIGRSESWWKSIERKTNPL